MKLLISFTLTIMLSFSVLGQSFEILETSRIHSGTVGEKISAKIPIRNLTDAPIQIVIKRVGETIGTTQSSFICWDGECLEAKETEIPLSKKIESRETSRKFITELEAGLVPGVSTVKYLIYNRDNPADAIEHEVNFTIEEETASNALFVSDDLQLDEIYPNPVTEFAIINYQLKNVDVEAKIVLHNVLGSIMDEYDLLPYENKLKITTDRFNPGVYFYTLYIDGDGVTTHKLVIRK